MNALRRRDGGAAAGRRWGVRSIGAAGVLVLRLLQLHLFNIFSGGFQLVHAQTADRSFGRFTFACPYEWEPCCGTWAGIATIAARHVNSRNDTIVPQISQIRGTGNINAASDVTGSGPSRASTSDASHSNIQIEISTQDRNFYESAYELVQHSQEQALHPPDGYIAFYYTSDVIAAHRYFVEKNLDTPLLSWGAASPVFEKEPSWYQNFYSLYPNDAVLAERMADLFVERFGWQYFACVHEPDSWSTGFITKFKQRVASITASGSSTLPDTYIVRPGVQGDYDSVVSQIQNGRSRVVVYIPLSAKSMDRMMETAARFGLVGLTSGGGGQQQAQINQTPWTFVAVAIGAAGTAGFPPSFEGVLSVSVEGRNASKVEKLMQMWKTEMEFGPLPDASSLGGGVFNSSTVTSSISTNNKAANKIGAGSTELDVARRQSFSGAGAFLPSVARGCEAYGAYSENLNKRPRLQIR
eukprot:g18209.t1